MKYFTLTLITLILIGCGGGNDKSGKQKSVSDARMMEKDLLTPPEQGGYGFENIADDLGFTTYKYSQEKDKTFFGDPQAKKGGTFNYIHSLFPRTMRVIGQNSSQVLNSRRIVEAASYNVRFYSWSCKSLAYIRR